MASVSWNDFVIYYNIIFKCARKSVSPGLSAARSFCIAWFQLNFECNNNWLFWILQLQWKPLNRNVFISICLNIWNLWLFLVLGILNWKKAKTIDNEAVIRWTTEKIHCLPDLRREQPYFVNSVSIIFTDHWQCIFLILNAFL